MKNSASIQPRRVPPKCATTAVSYPSTTWIQVRFLHNSSVRWLPINIRSRKNPYSEPRYITARYIEVCSTVVQRQAEVRKRTRVIEDVSAVYKLPSGLASKVSFFLDARFNDRLETRREAERSMLVHELSKELRLEVLREKYESTLKLHHFFAAFTPVRIARVCLQAELTSYTRGEKVQEYEKFVFRTKESVMKFVQKGAAGGEPELGVQYRAPHVPESGRGLGAPAS